VEAQTQQPKQLAHSFSSLEMFEACPKRFYHLRVAKDVKPEDSAASEAGTRDHEALEHCIKDGTPLPPHLQKHEQKVRLIRESGYEVVAEQELAINKELEPCEWWHPDVLLRVKADVALYTGTRAAVLDWKTGKRRPKPFQLELGAMAQWIHFPKIKSTEAAFLWLKEDASDKYSYTREEDYERILAKFTRKVDKVEEVAAEGVWQAKPGYHCNWCEAKNICSYSQAKR